MKELDNICKAINERSLKSKQAVFYRYYDDICLAKKLYSWEQITKYINENTDSELAMRAYKNMVQRAKNKNTGTVIKPQKTSSIGTEKGEIKSSHESVDVTKKNVSNEIFKEYLKVCFNKERIAKNAIDNDISIDIIREWGCPNFVQLNNAIGNYIRNR